MGDRDRTHRRRRHRTGDLRQHGPGMFRRRPPRHYGRPCNGRCYGDRFNALRRLRTCESRRHRTGALRCGRCCISGPANHRTGVPAHRPGGRRLAGSRRYATKWRNFSNRVGKRGPSRYRRSRRPPHSDVRPVAAPVSSARAVLWRPAEATAGRTHPTRHLVCTVLSPACTVLSPARAIRAARQPPAHLPGPRATQSARPSQRDLSAQTSQRRPVSPAHSEDPISRPAHRQPKPFSLDPEASRASEPRSAPSTSIGGSASSTSITGGPDRRAAPLVSYPASPEPDHRRRPLNQASQSAPGGHEFHFVGTQLPQDGPRPLEFRIR